MDYDIIWVDATLRGHPQDGLQRIRKQIRKKLKKGWELHGALVFYNGVLCQVMTRPSPE